MPDALLSLTGLAQVFDLLVAHADNILKYTPIAISFVALYYSRKALRFQMFLKRREHIAVVNLITISGEIPSRDRRGEEYKLGIEIRNPMKAPLLFAEGWYHHQYFGTRRFTLDLSNGDATWYRYTFDEISPQAASRRWEHAMWVDKIASNRSQIGSLVQLFYFRQLDRWRRARRPAKVSCGRVAIAEAFITDGARQTWYVNSNGTKAHWPNWGLPRTMYALLFRLRLLGYPFWSRFSPLKCIFLMILVLDIALYGDHFFNGGALLQYFVSKNR